MGTDILHRVLLPGVVEIQGAKLEGECPAPLLGLLDTGVHGPLLSAPDGRPQLALIEHLLYARHWYGILARPRVARPKSKGWFLRL